MTQNDRGRKILRVNIDSGGQSQEAIIIRIIEDVGNASRLNEYPNGSCQT